MTTIQTRDGIELEARWDDAATAARGAVVFCHPHPLDGGTMDAPLMRAVTRVLGESGFHVLRFNFRGVGGSEGVWGEGIAEVEDVAAAVAAAELAFPEFPVGVAGWSFGATTSLRWQAASNSRSAWAGIAPGIRGYRGSDPAPRTGLEPADRLIVLGDRDQFVSVPHMEEFASDIGADLQILGGSDHFFYFREEKVGALLAAHFGARSDAQ